MRLLALSIVLCCLTLLAVGCSNEEGTAAPAGNGLVVGEGKPAQTVNTKVGEPVTVGKVRVLATALTPTQQPSMPDTVMVNVKPPSLPEGQTFYQARLRIENNGSTPIRVDPSDFSLSAKDGPTPVDPTRSGPQPRSLLHGSSLQVIVTFIAPTGSSPEMIYSPKWFNGTIVIKGTAKPAGIASGRSASRVASPLLSPGSHSLILV